jgi:serine phosphatase RsbU (regulator of sigma subunit)/ligand-binding sensor domain-containing protein
VQDQTGFMWFATRSGLYRYNGYSYKLFKKNASDSLSLPHNDIAYLYADRNNNFWMRHYDELSAFKNEKRVYGFEDIIGKNFDIEVKIVQDKKNKYWIGPTTKGLLMYDANTHTTINYHCPPNTYTPDAWEKFESLLQNNKAIASINIPGNELDTTVHFTITQKGYFLIASNGEIDNYGKYDFGSLYRENKLIWELSKDKSMWAGSEIKNVFEAAPLELLPGKYKITYKSDVSHSCAAWDGKGPDKINFCGVSLIELSLSEYESIQSNYLSPFRDSTYIESEIIKDQIIDNEGNFWALTEKGLEKYNAKKQKFEHYPINFNGLLGADISKDYLRIYQDKQGIFWIGSMYGLIKYDHLWDRFVVFQNNGTKQVLTSNTIYSIFEDKNSQIWIGTDRGLNIYNKELNTLQKITANNHNRLYDNRILKIFEDKGGNIWVATFEGLNRLIKNQFTYTSLNINADNEFPAVYDGSANIWYALNNKISKYSRSLLINEDYTLPNKIFDINDFSGDVDYVVADMVVNTDQNIWIATDNRVSRFNIFEKKVYYSKELGAIIVGNDSIKNRVKSLLSGAGNKLYAFCPNGMYLFNSVDLTSKGFFPFNQTYDFIDEVDLNYFKSARFDKKGSIWIRTSDGMYQFNPHLVKLELIYEFDDEFKRGPLSEGKFDFDKFGNIWFATLPYLHNLNIESLEIKKWTCEYDHDWALGNVKVGKDNVYIYGSNGLYSFNIATEKTEYASVESGFIDNAINGVEEDNLGYLWLTGLKGLTKYDPEEQKSKNYFTSSDFATHQFLGNPTEFIVPTSEKILFTTTGFVSFYPDSVNSNIPNIVIDKFTIRGKEFELDSLIYYKKTLHLKHNQNFLGFEFAVLDYTEPSENRYRYKLEGLDEEWIVTDANNRRANYSGISPGKYTLKVIGSNNDKIWNEQGAQLQIIITPPWYKTVVAYLAYIILIASSIWLFIRVRERNLKEEKRILEQKVRERTAEIEAQKEELATQNEKIYEQHKNITDSIQYAQRIQKAILPPIEKIKEVVDDYFVLYRPRDIVSGDYYWSTRRDNLTIIVAADCTGHGVPGAFMSMLGIAFLNEIVNKEGITQPNEILNRLRDQIITQLHQTGQDGESKDGMDVSLYVIDHASMKLSFSGAYNPLFVIRNDEVIQLKADRMPIGYYIKKDVKFTMEEMNLLKGDCLYNSSDGYPDQFGGTDERKFMTKNFKELLLKIHKKPMAEQCEILNTTIDEWRGKIEQIDDIIVIGVKI